MGRGEGENGFGWKFSIMGIGDEDNGAIGEENGAIGEENGFGRKFSTGIVANATILTVSIAHSINASCSNCNVVVVFVAGRDWGSGLGDLGGLRRD